MSSEKFTIRRALVSAFNKNGLDQVARLLHDEKIEIVSTGGTQSYIEALDIPVVPVEQLTEMPSILGGRVKTLHPRVFGGILGRREDQTDVQELERYEIPSVDLVMVDLYPFEETLQGGGSHQDIIEKIDIGGVALIRAAAKNYQDVLVIPSRSYYPSFIEALRKGTLDEAYRRQMAANALALTSAYDATIAQYLAGAPNPERPLALEYAPGKALRYGENPHQQAFYFGRFHDFFEQEQGKALSYNNLVDVDAATSLISEFAETAVAIIKHTNPCGIAVGGALSSVWQRALDGDPVSAFGGIIATNTTVDKATAEKIAALFFEVLIAPSFSVEALEIFEAKSKRILLKQHQPNRPEWTYKSILNGMLVQENDLHVERRAQMNTVTQVPPNETAWADLEFALIAVKHAKSNTIVLARDRQLIGIGVGQTSRVDAARQAVARAHHFGFGLEGAVMASDAFFPFPDSIAEVQPHGIQAVVQPGGSIRDQESIDFCNQHGLAMVTTGVRHFKH